MRVRTIVAPTVSTLLLFRSFRSSADLCWCRGRMQFPYFAPSLHLLRTSRPICTDRPAATCRCCVGATRCGPAAALHCCNPSNSKFDFSTLDNRSYTHRLFYQADFCGSNGVILGEIGRAVVEIMAPGRLVARKKNGKPQYRLLPPTINLSNQFF